MTATIVRVPDPFAVPTFAVGAAKDTTPVKDNAKADDVRKLQIRVAAERDSILASALMTMYPAGRKHG